MNRYRLPWLTLIAALVALPAGLAAAAASNGLRAEVIVCGGTASEYSHRGSTYIEAVEGCDYAIWLSNDTDDRVAVHLAVDGLNVIDASETAPSRGPRWVLEPYQQATIRGWQTDRTTSRRFTFTTADGSYAEWVGDTAEVGKIEVVAYRERRSYTPPPITIEPGWSGPHRGRGDDGYQDWEGSSRRKSSADGDAATGAAADELASAPRSSTEADGRGGSGSLYRWRDDRAATGIGREDSSAVRYTSFDAERWAFARITLRYGYRDQLVAWGVWPRPYVYDPCPCCRGGAFAPDPYDRRCR